MDAIAVDSQGHAARERSFSPKSIGIAAIVAGAIGVAGLGVHWLTTAPPAVRDQALAVVAPARPGDLGAATRSPAAEALLNAPAATCVDGRPVSDKVSADSCR